MKKGESLFYKIIIIIIVFLIVVMLTYAKAIEISETIGPECSDGVDNDNDKLIDAQKTLLENTDTLKLGTADGYVDNPFKLTGTVAKQILNKKFPYTPTHTRYGGGGAAMLYKLSSSSPIDDTTLTKVCNIMGFRGYTDDHRCEAPSYSNRCNFYSPDNDWLWIYKSDPINDFKATGATNKVWLSRLVCEDRLPECVDEWDNDGDGTCDINGCTIKDNGVIKNLPKDESCTSSTDNSENPDPDCCNKDDTVEKTSPECSDGCDNDNDGLIDLNDPGCKNVNDISEKPDCDDTFDNDGDTLIDYCLLDNTNSLTCDVDCDSTEDIEDPECNDGIDNDNDGKIDFSAPIIASYSFNVNADDDSGNDNDGVVSEATLETGKFGQAYKFDGLNDYITVNNEVPFDFERFDPFSISLWLKPDSSDTSFQVPLSKMSNNAPYTGWNFVINRDGIAKSPSKLNLQIINTLANRIEVATLSNTKLNDGNWHHYVITYDGSSKAYGVKIYEDGVALALTTIKDSLTNTISNNNKVTIGDREGGSTSISYKGLIDEVNILKRVLNGDEINDLFTIGSLRDVRDPGCDNSIEDYESDPPLNPTTINEAFWGNAYFDRIETGKADKKDAVSLVVKGNRIDGKTVNLKIYKDDGDGEIDTDDDVINSFSIANYDINKHQIWKSGLHSDTNYYPGKYYFSAEIVGSPIIYSNFLDVSEIEKDDPPIVRIINPEDKQIYFKDELLTFKISYEDPDSEKLYIHAVYWGVPGSSDYIVGAKEIKEEKVIYRTLGQKLIEFTIKSEKGGTVAILKMSILIIDPIKIGMENYPFAYIDEPINKKSYPAGSVQFSGISSYAVKSKIENGILTLKCISGLCPKESKGCPPSSILQQPLCRIPIADYPPTTNEAKYDKLKIEWRLRFPSSLNIVDVEELFGVVFNKILNKRGRYYTDLAVLSGGSELGGGPLQAAQYFRIDFTIVPGEKPTCTIPKSATEFPGLTEGKSYWASKDKIEDSSINCFEPEGIPSQTCCPDGYNCNQGSDKCVTIFIDESAIDNCNDYSDEPKCKADKYSVARPSTGLECGEKEFGICMKKEYCRCEWNNDAEPKCNAVSSTVYYLDSNNNNKWDTGEEVTDNINDRCNPPDEERIIVTISCEYAYKREGDCNTGNSQIIPIPNDPNHCPARDPIPYKCASLARLGFFSWWNVFLVILVLFIIYFFHSLYKRKKRIKVIQNNVVRKRKK